MLTCSQNPDSQEALVKAHASGHPAITIGRRKEAALPGGVTSVVVEKSFMSSNSSAFVFRFSVAFRRFVLCKRCKFS